MDRLTWLLCLNIVTSLTIFTIVVMHYSYYSGVFFENYDYSHDLAVILIMAGLILLCLILRIIFSQPHSNIYIMLTLGVLIMIISGLCIYTFVDSYLDEDKITSMLRRRLPMLEHYDTETWIRQHWDGLQFEKCCGINGPTDWQNKNMSIPDSCCKYETHSGCAAADAEQMGCVDYYRNGLQKFNAATIVMSVILTIVQSIIVVGNLFMAEILPIRRCQNRETLQPDNANFPMRNINSRTPLLNSNHRQ